jgi:hypothetical protein
MSAFRRIAKYMPAAVLGSLVVAWTLSSVWGAVLWIPTNPTVIVTVFCSRIGVAIQPGPSPVPLRFSCGKFFDTDLTSCLGWFLFDMTKVYLEVTVPIPALITVILP